MTGLEILNAFILVFLVVAAVIALRVKDLLVASAMAAARRRSQAATRRLASMVEAAHSLRSMPSLPSAAATTHASAQIIRR